MGGRIERKYHDYRAWEDFKSGMYGTHKDVDLDLYARLAKSVLCNPSEFEKTLILVMTNWPISFTENMSNVSCNRRAWLGQAACCYKHGCNEKSTRKAWSSMTNEQRSIANKIASKFISSYEEKDRRLRESMGKSLLF